MAIIYSYPLNFNVLDTDIVVGTSTKVVGGKKKNFTKSFSMLDIYGYIVSNLDIQAPNLQEVTTTGNITTLDISVNGLTIGRGSGSISSNTAIGDNALKSNLAGNSNTASGFYSLFNNTNGSDNTANGDNALFNNTTGSFNVGIGSNTLLANASDTNSIIIGSNLTGLGSNTTVIGTVGTTITRLRGAVRGGSFVKDGGTSLQYLMADGSVSTGDSVIPTLQQVTTAGATTTKGIFANTNTETAIIATSSKSYGLIATSNSSVIPSAIFNISQPSNPNEIVRFQKEGTTLASVTNLGSFSGLSFIKTGGTSSQFLKADGSVDSNTYATTSGVILTTTDQTFNGIKSSINTGTSQINGLNLTNNGTTTNTFSIKVLNTNSGFGINAINNLGGNAIQVTNNGYGSGINVDSSDGVGVNIIHSGAAYGLRVDNSGLGEAIHIDNTSNGKAILVRGSTTSNGFLYVGQNDTTNTFTVNKTGDVTSNSFIKSGGTSSQYLMADGSVTGSINNRLVVEETTGHTLTNADSGGIIIFKTTAAQTLNIPLGLDAGFECTFVTLAGITLTVPSVVGITLNNATGITMAGGLSFTLKRMLATDTFIVTGNL